MINYVATYLKSIMKIIIIVNLKKENRDDKKYINRLKVVATCDSIVV